MKIKILAIMTVILCYSSIAFATAITSAGTSIGTAQPTPFKPSANVSMDAVSDGVHYGVTAVHKTAIGNSAKGGFQYGTTDQSPSLLRAPAPATGTTPTGATQPALPNTFVAF